MNKPHTTARKPAAFRLDHSAVTLNPLAEIDDIAPLPTPLHPKGSFWGKLLFSALAGLITLSLSLSATKLIDELFARSLALGWVGVALIAAIALAAIVMIGREIIGLRRLGRVEALQAQAVTALNENNEPAARALAASLLQLYAPRPEMAQARGHLTRHLSEIMDGSDLVRLTERELLGEIDAKATRLVMDSARRISLVTAISPRALFDITIVLIESARLIRRLADLYGARPGTIGMLRLSRAVMGHLAITGGMAIGDSLIQQLVGQGLAARLSAKLGEGIVNGMMTARIGISTIDLVRPMPFVAIARPKLSDVAAELLKTAPDATPQASKTTPGTE